MKAIKESEYEKYLELDRYPQPHVIMKDILIKKLITRSGLAHPARFLDIGCGRGRILKILSEHGLTGVGIDIQDVCLEICRKRLRGTGIELKQDLDEVEGTFDLIIMSSVLEHIEDDRASLKRVSSLLNPNGYFLFTVPGDKRLFGRRDIAYGHYRRYEREELIDKLSEAGLEIHTLWSYGINTISRIYRYIIKNDLANSSPDSRERNTEQSALHSDGFDKIRKMYPIYSKLMLFYKFQLLFLPYEIFRANYAGLFRKV
ncbi:MAG: class I SAM-dependent methyltransferase [Desulfobacterales bacterium]